MSDLGIDVTVAHPARRYNYWLGGKDNFAADRASGDEIARIFPGIKAAALENRDFLRRGVRYLAADRGVRQFLDIGTGLPTANNVHDAAQGVAPDSRIVYVDNDPLVLAHARALLTSTPQGATAYVDADLRHPSAIIEQARQALDFTQPIGLILAAVLHFIVDTENPHQIVQTLLDPLPPGSFLVLSHATTDGMDPAVVAQLAARKTPDAVKETLRTRAAVNAFFAGTTLLDPGLVRADRWRPETTAKTPAAEPADPIAVWAGVGEIRPEQRQAAP